MAEAFRTTIRLDYDQYDKLSWLSKNLNCSEASVMRKALCLYHSKMVAEWWEAYQIQEEEGAYVIITERGRVPTTFHSHGEARNYIKEQCELHLGEPEFVIQLRKMIDHWLHMGGMSYDLGSGKKNASTWLGMTPMKFIAPRGDERLR